MSKFEFVNDIKNNKQKLIKKKTKLDVIVFLDEDGQQITFFWKKAI